MRKRVHQVLRWLINHFEEDQPLPSHIEPVQIVPEPCIEILPVESESKTLPAVVTVENPPLKSCNLQKQKPKSSKRQSTDIEKFDPRDISEFMEVPFLALSKNRTKPILYKSKDGKVQIKISSHREQYLASIYDWDIVLLVAAKMQQVINSGLDIPPKTLIISRNKLLKYLHKHNGQTNRKEIEASLSRLKSTLIDTTVRNEDYKYRGGFGFLDSWGYTERKDTKEFRITLSDWLYDGICKKGALLKVSDEYFNITSGLKKFLYRTARKHVGYNFCWEFSLEKLYEKSGSEQELKKFKYDLRKAVLDNDLPDYLLELREGEEKTIIRFVNRNVSIEEINQKIEKKKRAAEIKKVEACVKEVTQNLTRPFRSIR